MKKKDLITVRDNTYDLEDGDINYCESKYVSAKSYVENVLQELKGKKERLTSFMTAAQYANELRASQYSSEEKVARENIESYMTEPADLKRVSY